MGGVNMCWLFDRYDVLLLLPIPTICVNRLSRSESHHIAHDIVPLFFP